MAIKKRGITTLNIILIIGGLLIAFIVIASLTQLGSFQQKLTNQASADAVLSRIRTAIEKAESFPSDAEYQIIFDNAEPYEFYMKNNKLTIYYPRSDTKFEQAFFSQNSNIVASKIENQGKINIYKKDNNIVITSFDVCNPNDGTCDPYCIVEKRCDPDCYENYTSDNVCNPYCIDKNFDGIYNDSDNICDPDCYNFIYNGGAYDIDCLKSNDGIFDPDTHHILDNFCDKDAVGTNGVCDRDCMDYDADCILPQVCPDNDGDGYDDEICGGDDCDDTDANINPGISEICDDNFDNNCNGKIDCNDTDCDGKLCSSGYCCDNICNACEALENNCTDGCDNDCDGLPDCADNDCSADPYCNRFCEYPCTPGCILPDKWDWRNVDGQNWMSPVKNQGGCGSCYDFSALGTVEGVYNVEQNNANLDIDLSEEYFLADCVWGRGCNGGWASSILDLVKTNGVPDENCLTYVSGSGCNRFCIGCSAMPASCSNSICSDKCADWNSRLWQITNYNSLPSNFDDVKRALICQGPLSVSSSTWGHAIVLASYDDITSEWTIKNSWGAGWGDAGYMDIPYSGHIYSDLKNRAYFAEEVIEP